MYSLEHRNLCACGYTKYVHMHTKREREREGGEGGRGREQERVREREGEREGRGGMGEEKGLERGEESLVQCRLIYCLGHILHFFSIVIYYSYHRSLLFSIHHMFHYCSFTAVRIEILELLLFLGFKQLKVFYIFFSFL